MPTPTPDHVCHTVLVQLLTASSVVRPRFVVQLSCYQTRTTSRLSQFSALGSLRGRTPVGANIGAIQMNVLDCGSWSTPPYTCCLSCFPFVQATLYIDVGPIYPRTILSDSQPINVIKCIQFIDWSSCRRLAQGSPHSEKGHRMLFVLLVGRHGYSCSCRYLGECRTSEHQDLR